MDRIQKLKSGLTVAIIHAPGERSSIVGETWDNLVSQIRFRGMKLRRVFINPTADISKEIKPRNTPIQLILVWGLPTEPCWSEMVLRYCTNLNVSYLIAISSEDLKRFRFQENRTHLGDILPSLNSSYHLTRLHGFLAGFFNGPAPYAYKKVSIVKSPPNWMMNKYGKGPFTLELGDPDEIGIVQCVFDILVNGRMTRNQILSSLLRQNVAPPGRQERWSSYSLTSMISDPVYIGANRYREFVRPNIFPSIIPKQVFYKAQSLTMNTSPSFNLSGINLSDMPALGRSNHHE